VMLLIDVSASRLFGTRSRSKRELAAEIAACLSFSASINNDKVGALFFSDRVEQFIPPKKGRTHLLRIIHEILEFEPEHKGTDISEALRFMANAIKKRCTAFLLSDMADVNPDGSPTYEDALKIAVSRHELSVINIYDERERTLPDVGLIRVKDCETGQACWVDTSSSIVRSSFERHGALLFERMQTMLRKYKVDMVSVGTDQDYVKSLVALFKSRA